MNSEDKPSFWDTEYFRVDPQTGKWLLMKDAPEEMHEEFKAYIKDIAEDIGEHNKGE